MNKYKNISDGLQYFFENSFCPDSIPLRRLMSRLPLNSDDLTSTILVGIEPSGPLRLLQAIREVEDVPHHQLVIHGAFQYF